VQFIVYLDIFIILDQQFLRIQFLFDFILI